MSVTKRSCILGRIGIRAARRINIIRHVVAVELYDIGLVPRCRAFVELTARHKLERGGGRETTYTNVVFCVYRSLTIIFECRITFNAKVLCRWLTKKIVNDRKLRRSVGFDTIWTIIGPSRPNDEHVRRINVRPLNCRK